MDPSPPGADAAGVGSKDQWDATCAAFGTAVRERREQIDISQEELADRAAMDRTYVSGIERGVRNPTLKIVARLAKALKTRPSKLLAAMEQ